ncbi:protein piccolo [Topomyia yanbarensis]|uniref:protein piccolo n=1 Tax=Topomyia yanbarensis TaxID=2498891 RepID=UPI00273C2BAE|nr:protein piccolo [Topomyia yanbarensis]XP_058834402.1 protein piccolo [Topomyia yanbarensis]
MQSTQLVDSPPDQLQYATDPLAIDQSAQKEPSSIKTDTVEAHTSGQSPDQRSEAVAPQSQPQNDFAPAADTAVQNPPPKAAAVSSEAIPAPVDEVPVGNAANSPTTDTSNVDAQALNNRAGLEDSVSVIDNKRDNKQIDSSAAAASDRIESTVPSADTSTVIAGAEEATTTEGVKSAEPNNDVPTSNGGSSGSSSSSASVSNGNSNSNSFIGVKSAVTSDNRIKINGISDLSILDVTEGNDDEIEVKVEGGSLMHKVIKFSLLNGMQDSTKRLENSRLIMSGVSSTNGEATLATTSSLCRGSLGGGPLRQDDKAKEEGFKGGTLDSKTTPPACSSARPESLEPSSSFSNSSNSSDSSSNMKNSENTELRSNRTEESSNRLRHSTESKISGSGSESVHEESVSDTYSRSASLDFREWPMGSTTAPTVAASTSNTSVAATTIGTASSIDLSKPVKETDHPTSAPSPPTKRSKAMYYAELPDFSKPVFTAPSLSTTTPTSTTSNRDRSFSSTKSLSQLQMKTPDFSRIMPATSVPQPSSSIPPASASAVSVSTTTSRSHELQIANPDFSRSFSSKLLHSAPPLPPPPSARPDDRASYLNQAAFAEISKQRNYISDLQLKNPPRQETANQPHSSVVKGPISQSSGPSLSNYRIEKPQSAKPYPPSLYRQEPTQMQMQLEEPKAHVIHKSTSASLPETGKTWNPAVEYSSKPYPQSSEKDRYSQQYPTASQKGPPPLTSESPSHVYPGYAPYPPQPSKSKEPIPVPTAPVTHPGGIIVNNVKPYYPEIPLSLPKSKEPDFRLEHKEKQLRQEGTIITLKPNESRPPVNLPHATSSHVPPQGYHQPPRPRSPSAEQRDAQMMASSQEILYRDFKLKQSYEMPPQSCARLPPTARPTDEPRGRPTEPIPRDRSPYDPYYRAAPSAATPPSKYYAPPEHHKQSISPASSAASSPTPMHSQNRSPAPIPPPKPQQLGGMHPPSGWPSQSRVIPSPHGGSANSSPISVPSSVSPNHFMHQKNSPSPVNSYGMQPGPSHGYKSPSPSSSSPSPYGTAGPAPGNSITKYTQYYPCSSGERAVSIEIDKESYKPGFKGLDYNMEQKFAEVYQAHQMKEKHAASVKPVEPYPGHPYPGGSAEYPRHAGPSAGQHPAYKPVIEHKPQESYLDEYGRSRAVSTSVVHTQPSPTAPIAASRYTHSQENLNYYNQYQYPPRINADVDIRKSEPQLYKPSSRDPSPAQRYASNDALYHSSKQPAYPPSQPTSSKVSHRPGYPPSGNESSTSSTQYGIPPTSKSSYPSSPYDRSSEKQPSVISNNYSQERAGPRASYPEQRPHPPVEHYPPGHHYPPGPQMKASASQPPYPQQHSAHPSAPAPSRDPAWHYQPPHQPTPPQPGSSGYSSERIPAVRDERQNPVIQPPISKNIPVKVIATANIAPAAPSSTTVAPATSTTKRESPLDLSVKTVKTKADSTASDDYAHSSRSREVVPRVNFNPNFKKHIPKHPERPPVDNRPPAPSQAQPYHPYLSREPQPIPPHQHALQQPASSSSKSSPAPSSQPEPQPMANLAIPPGYDKRTDAYMSANYRAVGGSGEGSSLRYQQENHYPAPSSRPAPPEHRELPVPYGIPPGPYPHRLPPGIPAPQHPYQQPGSSSKPDPYYPSNSKATSSASSRSVYYPPHEVGRPPSKHPGAPQKPTMNDPRIEDRKFVESMLKKQTSPSAEVIADLQAGKFSTRIPSALAPAKKRPAESIPKTSPTKVPRVEESSLHRPYDSSYRHPPYPGPAAPRDYYSVPIKHEPASPQPAGVYYTDKRSEAPSITRGVLTTTQSHTSPAAPTHSVLQQNVQQNIRQVDPHPSVITSYQPNKPQEMHRGLGEPPQQRDYRVPFSQPDDRQFYPKPEPFRQGHGDSKYYGSPVDKSSCTPDQNNHQTTPSTIVMHSHIQYSGQPPVPYKRPEVPQTVPRSDAFYNLPNHVARPPSIVENHHSKSYENIPHLISDPQKRTPPLLHSSQESLSQTSSAPSPQHRGADQSVISKLRTSLEQKERINQLRKQTSSEMSEEESKPADVSAFPPSHFRSKGAMKAYTPIPAFDMPASTPPQQTPPTNESPVRQPSPVKPEPVEIPEEPIEPPPDIEGTSALDILDWGSACNEFVEQLQTGKKRGRRKRGMVAKRENEATGQDSFRSDLPGMASSALADIPQEVLKSAAQEMMGDFSSSSDEDKPLHLLKQQQPSSAGELLKEAEDPLLAVRNSTMEKLSEKIARNIREKQRLELEQRHEAKLGRSSSSDSESDTRRVVQRSKMRARKLRHRSSVPLKLSDVNTDGEDEEEEEEGARDLRKRKKMEQTSSESEGPNVKRVSRCQSQIKQENGSDLSSDEDDSKARTPGSKDRAPEVKSERGNGVGAPSDSDGNDVKPKESVNGKKNRETDAQLSGNESEKSEKDTKKGAKKLVKTRARSKSKVVEESSESSESSVEELETMTRSKSKLELEKRRSNSKVLRNDKIVENCVKERKKSENITPQKGRRGTLNAKLEATKKRILDSDSDCKSIGTKKRSRKVSKLQTTSASDSSEESDAETVSERLRSRKQQKCSETSAPSSASKRGNSLESRTPAKQSGAAEKKNVKAEPQKKRGRQPKKTSKDCATENTSENFYPGWEKELYEFKRSLKVPPQLIMIGGRQYVHRISASLPDLDSHHSDESETFSEIVRKINQKDTPTGKKVKTKAASKQASKSAVLNTEQQEEKKKIDGNKKFSSIIELLHERMLRHVKLAKAKKSKANNDKEASKPKAEFELLPTPGAESEALFNRKKKSLFDTAIMKSRTRTEQKVMQSKEIIREVFGGEDERPQSAPPLGCMQQLKNVTYDEMYNEMLTKSNNVATFLAQKKAQEEKARALSSGQQPGSSTKVKIEDLDDETQDSVLKELGRVTEECDTPSVVSERDLATPVSFKSIGKKKQHKSRRKGSSGFDYIRKKKKPQPVNESSTPVVPKKKITSVFENLVSKDETHISKEIRSWVLNKGVGESVMHKAARLGYTDVIVYCLERLEMDPDLKDNAGYTPLHEACAKGHLDICNYLLQYGASHSETAPSGVRPLHEAVENSFIEVVRLLLAFGADPMLATYAGQTPIQLAENNEMALFLENHLYDIQSLSPLKTGWKMDGPWKMHDPEESGCNIFADIPGFSDDENLQNSSATTERSTLSNSTGSDVVDSKPTVCLPPPPPPLPPPVLPAPVPQATPKKCDSNSNIMNFEVKLEPEPILERKYQDCAVVLNDIHELNSAQTTPDAANYVNGQLQRMAFERDCPENCANSNGVTRFDESDDQEDFMFEYEEADRPLPPLYLLKDESGGDKWVLMTDLCNFLKLKSKEAVMKQICSSATTINTNNGTGCREIIRELKIEEFLTRASCLQLLCAGEKLNINSNKVILVKYNENVRNLLQVQTMVTKI